MFFIFRYGPLIAQRPLCKHAFNSPASGQLFDTETFRSKINHTVKEEVKCTFEATLFNS